MTCQQVSTLDHCIICNSSTKSKKKAWSICKNVTMSPVLSYVILKNIDYFVYFMTLLIQGVRLIYKTRWHRSNQKRLHPSGFFKMIKVGCFLNYRAVCPFVILLYMLIMIEEPVIINKL